jgi:2-amino-4-hydroxy-6-hydroxymethyldihydropteridine diphosphokinase
MDVVIGLGANQGEPIASFEAALDDLGDVLEVRGVSPVYRTAPIGPEQPDFLNAAVRAECALAPEQLLDRLLKTEAKLGRLRGLRWGPRVLDLDLLWIAGRRIDTARLCVPHPRLVERAFALYPLLDVAPDARDPRDGRAYRDLRDSLGSQRADRLAAVRIDVSIRD